MLISPVYGGAVRSRTILGTLALTLLAALALAGVCSATTAYGDKLSGTEVVPVSSTRGTFVGVATGQLPAAWRVEIAHEPLAAGPTVGNHRRHLLAAHAFAPQAQRAGHRGLGDRH